MIFIIFFMRKKGAWIYQNNKRIKNWPWRGQSFDTNIVFVCFIWRTAKEKYKDGIKFHSVEVFLLTKQKKWFFLSFFINCQQKTSLKELVTFFILYKKFNFLWSFTQPPLNSKIMKRSNYFISLLFPLLFVKDQIFLIELQANWKKKVSILEH